MESCIKQLKLGKSAGADSIVAEHITHLLLKYNNPYKAIICNDGPHSHVPESFRVGVITPVLKDKFRYLSSPDNNRPITLSPVCSKLFELVLIDIYGNLMVSDVI